MRYTDTSICRIDWPEATLSAYNYSLTVDEGDPIPHGRLVHSLRQCGYTSSNIEATRLIEGGVDAGLLTAAPGQHCPEYALASPVLQTEADVFPKELIEEDRWLNVRIRNSRKLPCAPWTGTTKAVSAHDSDNWTDFETAREHAETHHFELGFDFTGDDDLVFIDFDNARDPETGEVDPAVAAFVSRADSYADVSVSGTGIHVLVRGTLPERVGSPSDSFGSGDASIEVYKSGQFCVMTGQHVIGTPQTCEPRQELLDDLVEQLVKVPARSAELSRDPEHTREELSDISETYDKQKVFDAAVQVRPGDISLKSTVTNERANGTKDLDPSWEHSESGTRLGEVGDGWIYRKGLIWLDAIQLVALEERIIHDPLDKVSGEDFWRVVDALRERGAPIPKLIEADPQLLEGEVDHVLNVRPSELEALCKERGYSWPTTEQVRNRLTAKFRSSIERGEDTLIEAPTATGKSHTASTTPWTEYPEITGGEPVIHLTETKDARDENVARSKEAGLNCAVLQSRRDRCPVAAGEYDDVVQAPDGMNQTPSEWFDEVCDKRGVSFRTAHGHLAREHEARTGDPLPCSKDGHTCTGLSQWEGVPRDEDGEVVYDVIHATHQFAYVPGLIRDANVVIDEKPGFRTGITQARLQRMVTAWLEETDAPVQTWPDFITTVWRNDASRFLLNDLRKAIEKDPSSDWALSNPDAHMYAPAITQALLDAKPATNNRRVGRAEFRYPQKHDQGDQWEVTTIYVELMENYELRGVWAIPPLELTRCVIGLDAHPCLLTWELTTKDLLKPVEVLDEVEARLWRLLELKRLVVLVGEAVRPYTTGQNFNKRLALGLIKSLRDHRDDLTTAIVPKAIKKIVRKLFREAGAPDPHLIHYGEEKSRNDFIDELVGLLIGCIDPGDDYVYDMAALVGADLEAERTEEPCEECEGDGCDDCDGTGKRRAFGRGFVGPDADVGAELLASVRETHIAQAIGRYGREPTDRDEFTVVFVWTDAVPDELVDYTIRDIDVLTENQRQMLDYLDSIEGWATRKEIAEAVGVSDEWVRRTLNYLSNAGYVTIDEGAGRYGAHLYRADRMVDAVLALDPTTEAAV